ncbi:MAG: ribonucleotide-diphosphate reductase subunit beta [Methanobacteriaceae archaeon]|jgi:U3 small nucleolar ribonucleoprotein protein IMP4|nr:ribonucleotide-diphosphate reductase subunit beta [Methanobacteriaceae archaeon]
MLITTSRKPSSKTRKFCKNLSHATGSEYINRGKSNMREVLLKALEIKEDNIAIVNEIKGNPSKITFYSSNGDINLTILISASLSNDRLHINPKNLTINSEFDDLNILSEIFGFELDNESKDNYIHIFPIDNEDKNIAKIHFYNKLGNLTDFQISIKKILASD